jgi:hypothetical protein
VIIVRFFVLKRHKFYKIMLIGTTSKKFLQNIDF